MSDITCIVIDAISNTTLETVSVARVPRKGETWVLQNGDQYVVREVRRAGRNATVLVVKRIPVMGETLIPPTQTPGA